MTTAKTCREEILDVAAQLSRRGDGILTPVEVLAEMRRLGSRFADSTIRAHVISRMCTNAPDNHPVVDLDLVRVGHGQYRLT